MNNYELRLMIAIKEFDSLGCWYMVEILKKKLEFIQKPQIKIG